MKKAQKIYIKNNLNTFKRLKNIYHIYYIYKKMADEFEFFSNHFNNWNYNPFINTPNADPYN